MSDAEINKVDGGRVYTQPGQPTVVVDGDDASLTDEGGKLSADAAAACSKTGVYQLSNAGRSILNELNELYSIANVKLSNVSAEDIGLTPNDLAKGDQNATAMEQFLASTNFAAQTNITFRPAAWATSRAFATAMKGGQGISFIGTGGLALSYPEDRYGPSPENDAPWVGPVARIVWTGPVGTDGEAIFRLNGRGQSVRNLLIQGAYSLTGSDADHRAKNPETEGPACGIYIADDNWGHGTGGNVVEDCSIHFCETGVQIGSRGNAQLDGAANFGNSLVSMTNHRFRKNAILTFANNGGTMPPELTPGTEYYVTNVGRHNFALSLTYNGPAITFTTGTAGNVTLGRAKYSNADQFLGINVWTDRCVAGFRQYNVNSIGTLILKHYCNHCRYGFAATDGDMHVVDVDCNGLQPNGVGQPAETDFAYYLIDRDYLSGGGQSFGCLVDRIRFDGSIGQTGGMSKLLCDTWQKTNAAGDVINKFPTSVTFGEVNNSNEHTTSRLATIARLGGGTRLTIKKIRGLSENHFAVRSGVFYPGSNPGYGPDTEWRPVIRLENAEFFEPPADPTKLEAQLIDDANSVSGNRAAVAWNACTTYAGGWIDNGQKEHVVP